MKDQIQEILQREEISSSQFADRIGVQRSSVSHVISGRNKPGFDFIKTEKNDIKILINSKEKIWNNLILKILFLTLINTPQKKI